jgi:hypothetical protein
MATNVVLGSLTDLNRAEAQVLDVINRETRGGEMFLVDPIRFLREHGFDVGPALEADLKAKLPLDKLPSHLYEDIRAGKASVVKGVGPKLTIKSIRIESLGFPAEVLK